MRIVEKNTGKNITRAFFENFFNNINKSKFSITLLTTESDFSVEKYCENLKVLNQINKTHEKCLDTEKTTFKKDLLPTPNLILENLNENKNKNEHLNDKDRITLDILKTSTPIVPAAISLLKNNKNGDFKKYNTTELKCFLF